MGIILKVISPIIFLLAFIYAVPGAEAATLTGLKDTISTSRPSPSTPVTAVAASGVTQLSIADNGSRFFPGDVAKIHDGSGTLLDTSITVATQSALLTTVYFTSGTDAGTSNAATADVVFVPITAMHTVSLTTISPIPVGGKIVLTFPGTANNTAIPSSSGFAFNDLNNNASDVKAHFSTGTSTCTMAVSSPTITCTIATAAVASGTTVTLLIGCDTQSTNTCSAQDPRLINPTNSGTGDTAAPNPTVATSDSWRIRAETQDASSVTLDNGSTIVGTIESVQVLANVDPTLSYTITGLNTGTNISGNNSDCSNNTDVTDSGSTSVLADLGTLTTGIRITAQDITVNTNAVSGYALTATSSGQLRNPSSGGTISSSTTPSSMVAGTEEFGIHPCGIDVTDATWNNTTEGGIENGGGATGYVAWPTVAGGIPTLASRVGVASAIRTTVEYAATISGVTPAGEYRSEITYVVTATF